MCAFAVLLLVGPAPDIYAERSELPRRRVVTIDRRAGVRRGVLGAVLLLMRRKLTVPVLVGSFLCMVVTAVHSYGVAGGADLVGGLGLFFSAVVVVVSLALIVYARRMVKTGVLV